VDDLTLARQRIAREARDRTGFLNLGGLGLTRLPDELFELKHLRRLNLDLDDLGRLDEEVGHRQHGALHLRKNRIEGDLVRLASLIELQYLSVTVVASTDLAPLQGLACLRSLKCSGMQLSDLTPLQGLVSVQRLDCSETQVSNLAPLRGLVSLKELVCWRTRVNDLAPLQDLASLQWFDCSETQVSDLSPLQGLGSLQRLDCSKTKVSDLAPLQDLTSLQMLNCSVTEVSDLAPLRRLRGLQSLDCGGTQVSDLAPLRGLGNLQSLDCGRTEVSDLAPLQGLVRLQSLDCSHAPVDDLTPLQSLAKLQRLNCSYTQVTDLAPLRALVKLQSFKCWHTHVSELEPLLNLPELQSFDCSSCRLTSLSESFWFKQSLQSVVLFETQIPGVPSEVLSGSSNGNCLESLRAHLRDFAAGRETISDIKLMVLGNGRSGKTQLSRRQCDLPFQSDWDSTHGVRVAFGNLPATDGGSAGRLNIWDFGGQDIYHGTHALFVRTRAVFVLVWAGDTEPPKAPEEYEHQGISFRNHPLAYWVDYVRHLAQAQSPAIIVQTKCDSDVDEEPRAPVLDEALKALGFRREVHFSARNDRGRDELVAALRGAVAWLREREGTAEIGVGRLRVQRRIEGMRDASGALPPEYRLIDQDTFNAWCHEAGGVSSPEHLLAYLHNAGILFYRKGLFRDQIVLDHTWALNAIYAVFDRTRCYRRLQKEGGRFDRLRLDELIWREQGYPADEQRLFLGMMQSCGICFVYHDSIKDADETIYVAPDLLPGREEVQTELDRWWRADPPDWTVTFDYAFLHLGLMRSVIARIGNRAGLDAIYWRCGVCAYETTTQSYVLIEQEMDGWRGTVRLQTKGGQARELLERLVGWMREENERMGLQPEVKWGVPVPERSIEPLVSASSMVFGQEPATRPEYCVSYAWNDNTPEGSEREAVVDRLCVEAEQRGICILRDRTDMRLGDRITAFMRRLARGKRIFVILSEKYLRSIYCMTELYQIWQNCRSNDQEFIARVRVYTLLDAKIADLHQRTAHTVWWKREHARVQALVDAHGADILSPDDYVQFRNMGHFVRHVPEILSLVQDTLRPSSFEALARYGFAAPGESDIP